MFEFQLIGRKPPVMKEGVSKEVRGRWITALLCVLFLFGVYKCSSQTKKLRSEGCVSIYSQSEMIYKLFNGDSAIVSMYADSLPGGYKVTISIKFTQDIHFESLVLSIGLQYGGVKEFFSSRYEPFTGIVEFDLGDDDMEFLKSSSFDFISLDDRYVSRPSLFVRSKRYFIEFLSYPVRKDNQAFD
jgi:hypothetical protein